MKPKESWIEDWRYGTAPEKERVISEELLGIFQQFWLWADLDRKSKSTRQRYSDALHALGGWAVEKAGDESSAIDAHQILVNATSGGDGPLIHLDREQWQRELDTVCRKLYKFLVSES